MRIVRWTTASYVSLGGANINERERENWGRALCAVIKDINLPRRAEEFSEKA